MRSQRTLILIALTLLTALPPAARADDLAVKGRELMNRLQRAVVSVQVVLKAPAAPGRSGESRQETTGTVVNPDGLTVLSYSACNPTELRRRITPDFRGEAEISDLTLLLDDGTEAPAEIVLLDRDLDLLFIRPKTKPARSLPAVDLAKSGSAQVLDHVIALNRLNQAANRAYSASVERISAVVQKPRTFYIPDNAVTTTALGCPAFLPDGSLVGVFAMRITGSGGSNERVMISSIILPAEDILKAARRASEMTPGSGSKAEEKKPAAGAGERPGAAKK